MPDEKTPSSGAFLPASLMYFCPGLPMHFCSGVDMEQFGDESSRLFCLFGSPRLTV
jgi:hypothetical protein